MPPSAASAEGGPAETRVAPPRSAPESTKRPSAHAATTQPSTESVLITAARKPSVRIWDTRVSSAPRDSPSRKSIRRTVHVRPRPTNAMTRSDLRPIQPNGTPPTINPISSSIISPAKSVSSRPQAFLPLRNGRKL